MVFGAGSQHSQNVYHCVRVPRAGGSLMTSKARQEIWRATERELLRRAASMPVRHSLQNTSAPSALYLHQISLKENVAISLNCICT